MENIADEGLSVEFFGVGVSRFGNGNVFLTAAHLEDFNIRSSIGWGIAEGMRLSE